MASNTSKIGEVIGLAANTTSADVKCLIENVFAVGDVYSVGSGSTTTTVNVLRKSAATFSGLDGFIYHNYNADVAANTVETAMGTVLDFKGQDGNAPIWGVKKNGTPVLRTFDDDVEDVSFLTPYNYNWYDADAEVLEINNFGDFLAFADVAHSSTKTAPVSFDGQTIKLNADIQLNAGEAEDWGKNAPYLNWDSHMIGTQDITTTAARFQGTFDGQGHTISGIYLKTGAQYAGLFIETTNDAVIKNFRIRNSYFEGTHATAPVIGSVMGKAAGTFENIYSDAIMVANGSHVGGLFGQINGGSGKNKASETAADQTHTITNCWFDGELRLGEAAYRCGGITGTITQGIVNMTNCVNTGKIHSDFIYTEGATGNNGTAIGGLVGYIQSTGANSRLNLANAVSVGVIENGRSVGAILGVNTWTVDKNATHTTFTNVFYGAGVASSAVGSSVLAYAGAPISMNPEDGFGAYVNGETGEALDFVDNFIMRTSGVAVPKTFVDIVGTDIVPVSE